MYQNASFNRTIFLLVDKINMLDDLASIDALLIVALIYFYLIKISVVDVSSEITIGISIRSQESVEVKIRQTFRMVVVRLNLEILVYFSDIC